MLKSLYFWWSDLLLWWGVYTSNAEYAAPRFASLISKLKFVQLNVELKRVGEAQDGGYWLPITELSGSFVISGGIGPTSKFERQLAEIGLEVICFDASVQALPHTHPNITFEQKFLGNTMDDTSVNSHAIVKKYNHLFLNYGTPLGVLKLDIEGGEYGFILGATQEFLQSFAFIVIECHYLDSLLDPFGSLVIEEFFRKILQTHSIYKMERNPSHRIKNKSDLELTRTVEFSFVHNSHSAIAHTFENSQFQQKRFFDYDGAPL